jgi:hypothetical protein
MKTRAYLGWCEWADGRWTQLSEGESLDVALAKLQLDITLAREYQQLPAPVTAVVCPRDRPRAPGVELPRPRPSCPKRRPSRRT